MGFLYAVAEASMMFFTFFIIMYFLRQAGLKIRGDFGLFVLSGVACFILHNKVLQAITGVGGQRNLMPVLAVGPGILVMGTLLHEVYMQVCVIFIALIFILIFYGRIDIQNPVACLWILMLCIGWSAAMGVFWLAITPFAPRFFKAVMRIYMRIGIITSGKIIPGNMMPDTGLKKFFEYNPLFHIIDQMRGAMFANYYPRNSNIEFPLRWTIIAFLVGVVVYQATKKHQ